MRTRLRLAVVLMFVTALGLLAVAQGNGQADRRAAGGDQGRPLRGTQTGSATLRNTPPPAQEAAGVTRALVAEGRVLREWDDSLIARERARELRLRRRQADTLIPGRVHERLDQYYRGVPVFGGEAVRETDGRVTLSVTASIYSGVRLDTTPVLSGADAIRVFARETGVRAGPAVAAQLMILPRQDSSYALAYRVSAFTGTEMPVIFVNARTAGVELRYDDLKSQKATALLGNGVLATEGLVANDLKKVSCALQSSTYLAWDMMRPTTIKSYDLKGALTRAKSIFAGTVPLLQSDMASNTQAMWADPVVVDAHTYAGWTYDYYYTRHGWKGLNGNNGRTLYLVVHSANRADYTKYNSSDQSTYYTNAFYCGSCGYNREDLLMVGEGLPAGWITTSRGGQTVDYVAAGLDVLAHEYTHGVTDYTSSLVYRNESGALNEAFSDIMSVGVEFHQQQAGGGLLQADYLEGEDVWRPSKPGSLSGIRSLVRPADYGNPDHYSKRYLGTDDNGGVHINSSIASHAFYLAVEGGRNATSGLSVTGAGAANRDKVEKTFFRGFTTLTANATFSLAREKTIQAARDLYGAGSAVETAITQAWTAVGVF
jgi:bacillolysin